MDIPFRKILNYSEPAAPLLMTVSYPLLDRLSTEAPMGLVVLVGVLLASVALVIGIGATEMVWTSYLPWGVGLFLVGLAMQETPGDYTRFAIRAVGVVEIGIGGIALLLQRARSQEA